jgi:hypothetical protein
MNGFSRLTSQPKDTTFVSSMSSVMKNLFSPGSFTAVAGLTALMVCLPAAVAQDASAKAASSSSSPGAPNLTIGVPDVLKLSNAKVSDDTIVSFVQGNTSSYGTLSASEIVYLHDQGVSDRVVTAMLAKSKYVTETAAQPAAQPAPNAGTSTPWQTAQTVAAPQAPAPAPVTYVQSPPATTVYYVPNSRVDYPYYPNYGYYGYGYGWPALSLSFGFGSGYYGGYHGGGYYHGGGGYHGGGYYHGGGAHH